MINSNNFFQKNIEIFFRKISFFKFYGSNKLMEQNSFSSEIRYQFSWGCG